MIPNLIDRPISPGLDSVPDSSTTAAATPVNNAEFVQQVGHDQVTGDDDDHGGYDPPAP
jgi:hypothetical protein